MQKLQLISRGPTLYSVQNRSGIVMLMLTMPCLSGGYRSGVDMAYSRVTDMLSSA